jgi:hypothetical protein
MKKLIIAATVTILFVLISTLLATGFFGNFMHNEPSPIPTPTQNNTQTPTATPSSTPTATTDITNTIIVPDDYPTISSAIENAKEGNTIIVKNGVYTEPTLNITKSLKIISQNENSAEIIIHTPMINTFPLFGGNWEFINPIKINSNNVTLADFLISCDGGDINATGNGLKFLNNNLNGNATIGLILNGNESEVKENVFGYLSFNGNSNQIKNNQVTSITFQGSNNAVLSNQIIGGAYTGIFQLLLTEGNYNVIYNNNLKGRFNGLLIGQWENSSYNFVGGNTISVSMDSLDMCEGSCNVFYGNIVTNGRSGVGVGYYVSENNIFLKNSFIKNNQNALNITGLIYPSFFDDGVAGNYWDDYSGAGSYQVYNDVFDHFPLSESPGCLLDIPALPSPWNATTLNAELVI